MLGLIAEANSYAQIATKTWRTHANYATALGIEEIENRIYCFTQNGFFYYDKSTQQTTKLSKFDGLSETLISQIKYDSTQKLLIVAYKSGLIDLIKLNQSGDFEGIETFDFIKTTSSIQTSKQINEIAFKDTYAYLACDFGLVVFDYTKKEIRETYQNIGKNGSSLIIQSVGFQSDSIYVNTPEGILTAKFSPNINLQYYGNWQKSNNTSLFKPAFALPNNSLITQAADYLKDNKGFLWIADAKNGLLSNFNGKFESLSPNGLPENTGNLQLKNGQVYFKSNKNYLFTENLWQSNSENLTDEISFVDEYNFTWKLEYGTVSVSNGKNSKYYYYGNGLLGDPLSISLDKDGLVWIGTSNGVAVIATSSNILSASVLPYTPYYQGKRLLLQEKVNKILIDGGNRKWMGTSNGLFLFNANADEQISYFSEENSPLFTSEIVDLVLNPADGELFIFCTDGLLSYRTVATEAVESFENAKIFSNPVRSNFSGVLTITNLVENTTIKITDIAGNLVYETQANGGTAIWDLTTKNGQRASIGVYLVFGVSANDTQRLVGKFAVVN